SWRAECGIRICLRGTEIRGQGPAFTLFQRLETRPGRDAVQPGTQRRPSLELVVGTPGVEVDLLYHVFGVLDRAEHAVAVGEQLTPERFAQPPEILFVGFGLSHGAHDPPILWWWDGRLARSGRARRVGSATNTAAPGGIRRGSPPSLPRVRVR